MTEQTGGRGAAVSTTPIMNILGSDSTLRLVDEKATNSLKRIDELKFEFPDTYVTLDEYTENKKTVDGSLLKGTVIREFETSDGKKGKKIESVFKSLCGKISNMQMHCLS